MMTTNRLDRLKKWFDDYTQSFLNGDSKTDSPLVLKIEHTERVCANSVSLGHALQLSSDQLTIAETIGLFHDVGRFFQYRQYGTFNDQKSANHAVLSIRTINEAKLLDGLPAVEKALIIDAIRFHNAPSLPRNKSENAMLFMKLIRDADKLDIWKVFADYYRNQQAPEAAVVQHLSDRPECDKAVIDAIMGRQMARFQDMKTINDFRLLQLSWVFDLNFPESLSLADERGDLEMIAQSLPDVPEVNLAVSSVMDRLDRGGRTG